jgi:hypothetical protein
MPALWMDLRARRVWYMKYYKKNVKISPDMFAALHSHLAVVIRQFLRSDDAV